MFVLLIILLILAILVVDQVVRRARLNEVLRTASAEIRSMPDSSMLAIDHVPEGYMVAEGHTWARFEPTGDVRVGSDLLPIRLLGKPDTVTVLPSGSRVRRGNAVATLVRNGRELALRAPADGEVIEVNGDVLARPARAGEDPFGSGWLLRMRPRRPTSILRRLRVADDARAWMRFELARLRDAVAGLSGDGMLVGATLHDGGVPVDGLGGELDEVHWNVLVDSYFG